MRSRLLAPANGQEAVFIDFDCLRANRRSGVLLHPFALLGCHFGLGRSVRFGDALGVIMHIRIIHVKRIRNAIA